MIETKKGFRSLFYKYINPDLFRDLYIVTKLNLDNNTKGYEVKHLLNQYGVPYTSLGSGTNRFGVLIDGYAVKIALDEHGMTDNRREFKYAPYLYPYVVKVHECHSSGIFASTEYVEIFTSADMNRYKEEMRNILKKLTKYYLIGDIGITGKNYINWGIRHGDTDEIVILDFAYIYDVKYGTFRCSCDRNNLLDYDKDFNKLICPACGKDYSFSEIRKRITKTREMEEIGDITTQGYVLTHDYEEKDINKEFLVINNEPDEEEKEMDKYKANIKKVKALKKQEKMEKEKYLDNISLTESRDEYQKMLNDLWSMKV